MSADTVFHKEQKPKLEYFVSEKPPFAVVIFIGEMTKATLSVLEACHKDLSERTDSLYVIVFRDVVAVDLNALGPLTRLNKLLRDKGAVRTCSLKPEIKKFLVEKAAVREAECLNNLTEALESLKSVKPSIE